MKDIIVIVGPTGVGKTKLSIELAKMLDAEIINGDAVAVYKKLDIGSAKPSIEEREGIVHHLIDICDVEDNYSVYDFQKDVRKLIDDINRRGKRIIIVGGTGLYIKSALYDYRFEEEATFDEFNDLSNQEILNKILEYDSSCSIHVNNRRRLVRLLNKYINNSEVTDFKDNCLYPCKIIGLTAPREVVYDRINKRVDKMVNEGLIDEINSLRDYFDNSRVLNSAIGYKEFRDYLFNGGTLDDAVEKIKLNSRRFAKRQYTFFNNQFSMKWFDTDFDNFNNTVLEVYKYLN